MTQVVHLARIKSPDSSRRGSVVMIYGESKDGMSLRDLPMLDNVQGLFG